MTYQVAILGAGFGGLGMARQLKAAGEDSFVILEKASRIGGTWRDNSYPGCACDIPSHLYWYSFEQQPPDWSEVFSPQEEILGNLESFVDRACLRNHIRLNSEVTAAQWDETRLLWSIRTAAGETILARTLIAAWGQLNRPILPAIEGRDSFVGPAFHSAQWRHDVDLTGKQVACIGSGASAIQIIPAIAPQTAHLSVFQRSAPFVVPRGNRPYEEPEREQFQTDSQSYWSSRDAIYQDAELRFGAMLPGSVKHGEFTAMARAHLESQVSDPVLREKLWPDYPLGCKRVLLSDDFYPAITRSNVELVTAPIVAIEPSGIRTADGQLHAVDVILYSTGFETNSFLGPVEIGGRHGRSLREQWRGGPRAYLGITVENFPNFFLLYGPNTNLGHNSIIAMLECQYRYVMQALEALKQESASALEVRGDAADRFHVELQERLRSTAWSAGCHSWYKTADGHIVNNWSGSVEDYKAATARLETADYELYLASTSVMSSAGGAPPVNSVSA
jgi:cation diffusion facilitator CzcD-associated flavoprotein CzcO